MGKFKKYMVCLRYSFFGADVCLKDFDTLKEAEEYAQNPPAIENDDGTIDKVSSHDVYIETREEMKHRQKRELESMQREIERRKDVAKNNKTF